MSSEAAQTQQSTPLWVRILLAVSLGLNILVVGAVVGFAIKGGPLPVKDGPRHVADAAIGPLTRALSVADRRAIGRQIRQEGTTERWDRQAHRQALERMLTLLNATPFDADAFANELDGTVTGLQSRMTLAGQALVVRLEQMTDEERRAYAERVLQAAKRKTP